MKRSQQLLTSIAVIFVVLFFFIRLVILVMMQFTPELGVQNGRFLECPAHSACVSSQADPGDESQYVEPIANGMPVEGAEGTIKIIMKSITGARLVSEDAHYLHYEIIVQPFGFVSDVEFYFPRDNVPVEVRSSARALSPGIDIIRYRVELIRERYTSY